MPARAACQEVPIEAHPEHTAEQGYIDGAYGRLDEIRAAAVARAARIGREASGRTPGSVYDRDVGVRVGLYRAEQLDIGDESLIFGRTDGTEERYYVGRRAVFDQRHEPMVIDWRVPAAEPFYRATGREPMGLLARRHFLCRGRTLLSVEEERFDAPGASGLGLAGTGALLAALERPRTGRMTDIVATIQAEQDMIIRDDLDGVLAVQGGPGTGKTAVALHRAAFLLFTHRRKLGRQGVLVVGPNEHFLRYIDRVLPALGESGATLVTLPELLGDVDVHGTEPAEVARLKGDPRMARVIERAVKDRERPLRRDLTFTFDEVELTITAEESKDLVTSARRNRRTHNARHAMLASILAARLDGRYARAVKRTHGDQAGMIALGRRRARAMLRKEQVFQEALDEMWPLLTPQRLLRELFASRERIDSAGRGLGRDERALLHRRRNAAWTASDVPLLDEAFTRLGAAVASRRTDADDADLDERETYGHIVVDEVQDNSPMALRMLSRRSRAGSMTIVGDLAQAVGAWTPGSWDEILAHLPQHKPRIRELTINYRTPGPIMDVAAAVLRADAPHLVPPTSVRAGGDPPELIETGDVATTAARLANAHRARGEGTMVIIAPPSLEGAVARAAHAPVGDIGAPVTVMTVEEAKGLEFDDVVVVEPARLVAEATNGARSLYVALTRATQRASVVYAEPLPEALARAGGRVSASA
jgi:DNA helicase IV